MRYEQHQHNLHVRDQRWFSQLARSNLSDVNRVSFGCLRYLLLSNLVAS